MVIPAVFSIIYGPEQGGAAIGTLVVDSAKHGALTSPACSLPYPGNLVGFYALERILEKQVQLGEVLLGVSALPGPTRATVAYLRSLAIGSSGMLTGASPSASSSCRGPRSRSGYS